MKLFLRAWMLWSIIWVVVLVVAYLASNGEPVCEGPLILAVDESFPPQCDEPIAALPMVGVITYVIGFVPSMLLAAFLQARGGPGSDGSTS